MIISMTKLKSHIVLIIQASLILVGFISCADHQGNEKKTGSSVPSQSFKQTYSTNNRIFHYDLSTPSEVFSLPRSLAEISGISWYRKNELACVQDEKGVVSIYDLKKRKIISTVSFGNAGDYEDLVTDGDTVFIIRSNGVLYRIEGLANQASPARKMPTPLTSKNDPEGLTFDKLTRSLWIACKGSTAIHPEKKNPVFKAVFRFDLVTETLTEIPLFLIDPSGVPEMEESDWMRNQSVKLGKALHLLEDDWNFQPSGIAIHPLDSTVYVLSHIGKWLLVLEPNGKVQTVHRLDPAIFRQPEGICFSPEGDLYIANEGAGRKGNIVRFNHRKK